MHGFGSVVGIEQDERLLVDSELIDKFDNSTHENVEFPHEVSPGARVRCSVEFRSGKNRSVSDLGREDGEEGLLRVVLSVFCDELPRLFVEEQVCFDELIPGSHPSLIIVPAPFATGIREVRPLMALARGNGHHAVLDVDVKWVGRGAIGSDKRLIETASIGTVNQRRAFLIVDEKRVLEPTSQTVAVLVEPGESHVPLPENTRPIAFLSEHFSECERTGLEVARSSRSLKGTSSSAGGAVDLLTGIQTVPGRRANGRRAMGVGEPDSLSGHPVKLWRLIGSFGVVAGQIPVPQIVSINDHNVGQILRAGRCQAPEETKHTGQDLGERESNSIWSKLHLGLLC